MTTVHEAIDRACAEVGIVVPRETKEGRWIYTDTFERNGKGDGRVRVDGEWVIAKNWQSGVSASIRIGEMSPEVRRQAIARKQKDDRERVEQARKAAWQASQLVLHARTGTHAYLARKGFPLEKALIATADQVRALGIKVPDGEERAIVIPAKVGERTVSAQLIWASGEKKYLFGGEMGGAHHRLRAGAATWLCEGFATALSLRAVLHSMKRSDGVLMCFHASNLPTVARRLTGRVFVAADHDKPQTHFDGLGTGEHYAKETRHPYIMPPVLGQDINDMHQADGVFAVQKLVLEAVRAVNARG